MTAGPPADVSVVLERYFSRNEFADLHVTAGPEGFSGASVWKVQLPASAFALRRWPQPGLPAARLRGLHRLLQHLATAGLPFVAVPIRSQTGETLLSVDDRFWQLEPWLPGVADYQAHPTEQRLRSVMAALARWHDIAAKFRPNSDVRQWFGTMRAASPAVLERLVRLRQFSSAQREQLRSAIRQESEATRRQFASEMLDHILSRRDFVMQKLESLSHEPFTLQPCLRDVWHDHVLFSGDDVTGLIDPSACRMENVATDLARLLGSLVEDDAAGWQTAMNEYRRLHPLTLKEEALVVALDKSGVLLSALTWLEWLFIERRSFSDPAKVDERLQWLHWRLRNLVS